VCPEEEVPAVHRRDQPCQQNHINISSSVGSIKGLSQRNTRNQMLVIIISNEEEVLAVHRRDQPCQRSGFRLSGSGFRV